MSDVATNTTRADGSVIPADDKTIENHFQFHNAKIPFGMGHTWFTDSASHGSFGFDFGISAHPSRTTCSRRTTLRAAYGHSTRTGSRRACRLGSAIARAISSGRTPFARTAALVAATCPARGAATR